MSLPWNPQHVIPRISYKVIYLGKLQYFTNLNLAATKGDDSPI